MPPASEGEYVVYWMQAARRFHYNFGLEYAVAWANKLHKPLLIYEAVSADYPWACNRFHGFILEGMKEHLVQSIENGINYYPYVEPQKGRGSGLLYALCERACILISDEFPVFIVKQHNEKVAQKISIPFITVDSNGIIPMNASEKEPYSAFHFRGLMQKFFVEAYSASPKENPLDEIKNRSEIILQEQFLKKYPSARSILFQKIETVLESLPINHGVGMVSKLGDRASALKRLNSFIGDKLQYYADGRNHPDSDVSSGLSSWLHYGKISVHEIVGEILKQQPQEFKVHTLRPNKGLRQGFFGGYPWVEAFLDELITWREIGFHFAHHCPDYDRYESLPKWARDTLEEHSADRREVIYSLDELDQAKTGDPIWNAAQRQLREEGIIHNYLRMLWGKKVMEWTENPEIALEYLIELNNKYALDGRDPNSYSGIFWCFGRFDRAWQERAIFGKIRYMSSDNTQKKLKLSGYLSRFGV